MQRRSASDGRRFKTQHQKRIFAAESKLQIDHSYKLTTPLVICMRETYWFSVPLFYMW